MLFKKISWISFCAKPCKSRWNWFFKYDNFLSDPIYDWLIKPEEVLIACADLDKEIKEQNKPKQKSVTIIQQPQPLSTGYYKKVTYRRGLYKKKLKIKN